MYLQHFGFSEKPFSLTPDTHFFYANHSHTAALNTLLVALNNCEGFIKVVGEIGTGKTLLGRLLLKNINKDRFVTAYLPNPHLSPDELKQAVAKEIGLEQAETIPAWQLTLAIQNQLIAWAKQGKQVVLVIDEAQTIPRESLEALRLLTNLETEKRKLLQIVLLGQPELDTLLNRDDLRQLKQRIVFSEKLKPLDFKGLVQYVEFRVRSSNAKNFQLFSFAALLVLFMASKGVPRMANILCHKALLCTYAENAYRVDASAMRKAIKDTEGVKGIAMWLFCIGPAHWWLAYTLAGVGAYWLTLAGRRA